ncbi:hypothetical protein [Flagellimonas sp.]|uniref:hypothetical protein n=1 Tax=Flagellimonas sp. TaxID=2058762 RepID=UPI003B50241A
MKKYFFQIFTFLFLLCLTLLSCETEPMEQEIVQEEQPKVVVEAVDFNSIPELSEALNGVSGKSKLARSFMDKGDAKFWIEEQDVLKLRDSVSNESYTVRIYSDDPSPKTFYNLVVTKRVDGNPIVPFVVKYKFENGDVFSFAEDEEKNFDGTVSIYSLDEFANSTGLNARDTQPVACFQDIGQRDNTVAGNTGSSSSGGSSGGSSTTGSTGSTGTISVTRTHISVNTTYGSRGTVSVGQGTFYMPPLTSDKQDQKSAGITGKDSNPCPEGWVSIPINVVRDVPPPDCASFNFKKTSSNWQQANVVGIHFDIYLLTEHRPYVEYKYTVELDRPVNFGAPVLDRLGNTTTPGLIASVSAAALQQAMSDTARKYGSTRVHESVVTEYFKQRVKDNYSLFVPGGRANTNSTSTLPATQYKATTRPDFGGCD